jgi:DNA primase
MDAVEEIKARLGIEDVVSEYVQLKRAGRNYKGLSPFTSEKSPSFMVSPEKQIWHDFSSGKGGDMISFVMEVEGLDFKGALELLARKAGVELEQFRMGGSFGNSGGSDNKERLYEILEMSAKYYQIQFSKSKVAYEYALGKRQFSKETALEWRLGYAPDSGSALVEYLRSKKCKDDEIKAVGLGVVSRYGGGSGNVRDMFRGRLMIPLQDPQGRVIGFTARLLKDDPNAPKYINTPQTALYDKSRHVYGLHLAKEAIRKSGYAVMVEGNLDVIASHQAGVRQVVATAGTALTEPNLKTLGRFSPDVRLAFDADRAGVAATERAIPIASKVGVSLGVITIPSGKDPDELIRNSGVDVWRQVIDQSQYALDWLIGRYQNELDLSSAPGKKQLSDILLPVVRQLQDSVEQDHYMNRLAELLGVSRDALVTKLNRQPAPKVADRKKLPAPKPIDPASKEQLDYQKNQEQLLALLLFNPALRRQVPLVTAQMFSTGKARHLFGVLQSRTNNQPLTAESPELTAGLPAEQVQILQDYAKIISLQYEELYGGFITSATQAADIDDFQPGLEAQRLQARLIEQYIKNQKHQLSQALGSADESETRRILQAVAQLDALRNRAGQQAKVE